MDIQKRKSAYMEFKKAAANIHPGVDNIHVIRLAREFSDAPYGIHYGWEGLLRRAAYLGKTNTVEIIGDLLYKWKEPESKRLFCKHLQVSEEQYDNYCSRFDVQPE